MVSRPYDGQAGRTAWAETTVWCGGCGAWFGGRVLRTLDGDANPDVLAAFVAGGFVAINAADCPGCNWRHTAEEPFTVHVPSQSRLFLVVPEGARHRAQEARARVISDVAGHPGQFVPAYALEPVLVAGSEKLSEFIEPATGAFQRGQGPATLNDGLDNDEPIFAQAPKLDDADLEPIAERLRPTTGRLSGLLAAVLGEEDGDDSADSGSPVDESWALASTPESSADQDPTSVMHRDELTRPQESSASVDTGEGSVSDIEGDHASGVSLTELGDSTDAMETTDRWVEFDETTVRLVWAAPAVEAEWLEAAHIEIRFQQHTTPHGRAWVISVFEIRAEDGVRDVISWGLEPSNSVHEGALGALAERFALEVACVGDGGEFTTRRVLSPPLEENVARALDRSAERGGQEALKHALGDDFDRCGMPQHNFKEDSFTRLETAVEVRLSLGIIGYWTLENLTAHLLDVLSFPSVWFDAMVMRVLQAAIDVGLAFEPHLRAIAVADGLLEDEAELLGRLVENFGQFMMQPDHSGMDLLEQWENWERLLTWADVMGIDIPANRQGQALAALEAAHAAEAQANGDDPGNDGVIELSIRDALLVESMSSSVGLVSEEGQTDWDELSDATLIELLQGDVVSPQPVYELLRRGDALYAPTVLEAVWRLPAEALAAALPILLAQGETYGSLLGEALGGEWPQRPLAAVLLAELGDARSASPLLEMVAHRDDERAAILAEGAARLGAAILGPALESTALESIPMERLARLLMMVGEDAVAELNEDDLSPKGAEVIAQAKSMMQADGPHLMSSFAEWVPSVVGAVLGTTADV